MKFTVLGSSGLIGQALVKHLKSLGHIVLAPTRHDQSYMGQALNNVIYCIGLTADFRQRPLDTVEAHVGALVDVFSQCIFDNFVYLSSTRIYQGAAEAREDSKITVSSTDLNMIYDISKLMGESVCLNAGKKGTKVVRLSNVLSPIDQSTNFISDITQSAIKGKITLHTTLASAKDYILIDDVVELLPQIAVYGRQSIYNIASGYNMSHKMWVDELTRLTGCKVEVADDSPIINFPVINIKRIQTEFGFNPRNPLSMLPKLISELRRKS